MTYRIIAETAAYLSFTTIIKVDLVSLNNDNINIPAITLCDGFGSIIFNNLWKNDSYLLERSTILTNETLSIRVREKEIRGLLNKFNAYFNEYSDSLNKTQIFKQFEFSGHMSCKLFATIDGKFDLNGVNCDQIFKKFISYKTRDKICHTFLLKTNNQNKIVFNAESQLMRKQLLRIIKFYSTNSHSGHSIKLFIHSINRPYFALGDNIEGFGQQISSIDEVIELRKTTYKQLEWPFGQCSHYSSDSSAFNSISNEDCLRKCVLNYFIKRHECFYWNFSKIITEFDQGFDDKKYPNCNLSIIIESLRLIETYQIKCHKLCPKDCTQEDYEMVKKTMFKDTESSFIYYSFNNKTLDIEWDESQPIITYLNTPFMMFYDLIFTFGGILGIYFGLSVYHIIFNSNEFTRRIFGKITEYFTIKEVGSLSISAIFRIIYSLIVRNNIPNDRKKSTNKMIQNINQRKAWI